MENLLGKASFLRNEYTGILSTIKQDAPRKWGKMSVQQMVEHMCDYVRIANGRTTIATVTPEDVIPKMQDFLKSEKPFRENTPNSLMSDTPDPVRLETLQDAIGELSAELAHFFAVHEANPETKFPNPFFGMLDFDMQVQLLHKHATHHLRQFGIDAR